MAVSTDLQSLIKRPQNRIFRRLYIKRRESDGEYESDWFEIEGYRIKSFGNVSRGEDNERANFYKYSGMTFEMFNQNQYFGDTDNINSIFYQKLSRYRTLVKVEFGYLKDDDTEIPTNSTIYLGIVGEGITEDDKNTFSMETNHLSQIFDEVPADQVTGLGSTQTASDVITKIRDHQDANNVAIFQKFFTLGAWTIETTTNNYNMATSTTLRNKSCWDLMRMMAEAENKDLYIDRTGSIRFETRTVTSNTIYHFSGANDETRGYGKNIIGDVEVREPIDKVFNRIRIQHEKDNTTTSFYTLDENWNWGDSSSSFKYGVRTYEYRNEFLDSATAQTVANTIFNKFQSPLQELIFRAKINPELEIGDKVSFTHLSGKVGGRAYGAGDYGSGIYGDYDPGAVNIIDGNYLITSLNDNIDSLWTTIHLEKDTS